MTKTKIAIKTLESFKKFQEKENGKLTVRDFDAWCSGFISGIAHAYSNLSNSEIKKIIKEISEALVTSEIAKNIGVTGTEIDKLEFIKI